MNTEGPHDLPDPPRLLGGESTLLQRALAAAKSELPSAEKLALLEGKLAVATAAAGGAGAGVGTGVAAAKSALWLKAAIAFAGASVIAVTTVVVMQPKDVAPTPQGAAVSAQLPPAQFSAPQAVATEEASAETREPLPVASAPKSAPSLAPAAATTKTASSDLTEETRLLTEAQHALASNPGAALRLCDQHRAKFGAGVLSQERDAVVVEALVKQGRRTEAKRAAAAFARNYPGSSHLRRITDLVAD